MWVEFPLERINPERGCIITCGCHRTIVSLKHPLEKHKFFTKQNRQSENFIVFTIGMIVSIFYI